MPDDLVIDTNVWAHSYDPRNALFTGASHFIELFMNSDTKLVFDEGFESDEAKNTSGIFSEYKNQLSPTSTSFIFLSKILEMGRYRICSTNVSAKDRGIINKNVTDPTDRKFVKVAINAEDHFLVSNDSGAFPDVTNRILQRQCGVKVFNAEDAQNLY